MSWEIHGLRAEENTILRKWGVNASVGTSLETVWSGSSLYVYPSSALAMTAVSTAADTHELTVTGLDANGFEVVQTVTLNGITPVSIPIPLKRVYRAFIDNSVTNAGLITIDSGIVTYARIEIGVGQTQMALWTVPTGFEFELIFIDYSVSSGNTVQLKLVENRIRTKDDIYLSSGFATSTFGDFSVTRSGQIFTAGTDLEIQAVRQSGSNAFVSARFIGRLLPAKD